MWLFVVYTATCAGIPVLLCVGASAVVAGYFQSNTDHRFLQNDRNRCGGRVTSHHVFVCCILLVSVSWICLGFSQWVFIISLTKIYMK